MVPWSLFVMQVIVSKQKNIAVTFYRVGPCSISWSLWIVLIDGTYGFRAGVLSLRLVTGDVPPLAQMPGTNARCDGSINGMDTLTPREQAKLLYTTTPDTFSEISGKLGLAMRSLMRWSSSDGGWKKLDSPELARAAEERAKTLAEAKSERDLMLAVVGQEAAIDLRAAVIEKHRLELLDVRRLIEEATQKKDAATARLAGEICKATDLLQKAERRAWGLDTGDGNTQAVTVIVERG